jgi:fermentation-respiration switch protein FrsA (DUF1100 family)
MLGLTKSPLTGVAALGALYLALSPRVAHPLYRHILFHPDKYPVGEYHVDKVVDVPKKDVFFPSLNGKILHGWYFIKPGAKKTLLFHHGNGGNLTTRLGLIEMMLESGASVLAYDYQGYGRSEGIPSVRNICEDAVAAYNYLTDVAELDPDEIVIYGESLGTGVASYLSQIVPSAGLILQSGFLSLQRIGSEHLPPLKAYPSWLFPQPNLDNLAVVKQNHPPLLIIHGFKDVTVPFAHAEELYKHALEPKALVRLENTDHIDHYLQDYEVFCIGLSKYLNNLPLIPKTLA